MKSIFVFVVLAVSTSMLYGCTTLGTPPARMGMVKDPETGLMLGSVIERNLVTDASFFKNRSIKVRTRNTSGDAAFDLGRFSEQLRSAYRSAGYEPTDGNNFGLLVDVNVMYSGQVQTNLSNEYAFLGAAAGGIAGYRSSATAGTAIGAVAGATLGSIIGSFVTDDTYIIVAQVTVGVVKEPAKRDGKTITFSRGISGNPEDEEEKEERRQARGLKNAHRTGVAVFAGGRNVRQTEIAGQVRERIVRIVKDII